MPSEPYVDKAAAAEHLGVSVRTIEDWVYRRQVPFHHVGRLVRFRLSELDRWVSASTKAAS